MTETISLLTKEITHTYMMILIAIIFTVFIASIIIIVLSKTSLFKKWTRRNKGKSSLALNDLNVLGLKKNKKKGEFTKLEGIYKDRSIKISRFEQKNIMYGVGIVISSPFYDAYPLLKPNFIKAIFMPRSKLYFYLHKKRVGIKWSNFENTFKMRNRIATKILSKENELNLESLFHKGYFDYVLNASLTVEVLYNKKFIGKREGRVVFKLPMDIVKDIDSLKIAMDIVVEVAKKMDKTAKNDKFNYSATNEIKKDICEFWKNNFIN